MNQRPSVDPAFTFGVALLISALLWYPTLRGAMSGDIEITSAGIRYMVALAISWAGVYGISALVAMYASQPRRPKPSPPGVTADTPQRRQGDLQSDTLPAESDQSNAA
jgi:hypothetical protein